MEDNAIRAALDYQKIVNATPGQWARFEALKFNDELIVRVYTGTVHRQGTDDEFKESYSKIRAFFNLPEGKVTYIDSTLV